MNIIIDPEMDGCTLWIDNKVRHIHGDWGECMVNILPLIAYKDEDFNLHQANIPMLDCNGIGAIYKDIFDRANIKYIPVKPLNLVRDFNIDTSEGLVLLRMCEVGRKVKHEETGLQRGKRESLMVFDEVGAYWDKIMCINEK